jgi:iron(III) transport system permease protein
LCLRLNGWTIATLLLAALLALPILTVLAGIGVDTRSTWQHLAQTVLAEYIGQSLLLMLGVGVGVALLGTVAAWLVTMCQFPGRRLFEWGLLLPMAAPAYILAYTYTELLEYYGPIQATLRQWFGWQTAQDYWFPPVRSLGGAIVMLALVLYPYVYLLARSAFLNQSVVMLEASRSLGCPPWQSFFRVALPMARPAIMAGLSLALMETLNDYGTVDYFSVSTFTTGIFRIWFGMGARQVACQFAALSLLFILMLVGVECWSRQRQRYYQTSHRGQVLHKYQLRGGHRWLAVGVCLLPISLGFGVPAGVLLQLSLRQLLGGDASLSEADYGTSSGAESWRVLGQFAANSLTLALVSAAIAVLLSVFLAYAKRLHPQSLTQIATQAATSGYAIPGTVIAVGILVPLGQLDNVIDRALRSTLGISTRLLVSGTIAALVFAYLVRFLAIAFSAVESSLGQIKPHLDDAARSLGCSTTQTLCQVHLPLMRSGLISAVILVFVDVMKELPATLLLRPLNFDTLAVRVYNLASDERLTEAALPALLIVVVGLIPVILLSWQMTHPRPTSAD